MKLSRLGAKLTDNSGILQLMHDLGDALAAGDDILMLGGGNPARIPEVEAIFIDRLRRLLSDSDEMAKLLGSYDAPAGNRAFIEAMAALLREHYGWEVGPENVALTTGSQTSFFFLFNLLGGESEDGRHRKIFLPLTPEYIGYADTGIARDLFVSEKPEIELLEDDFFKYHVDFDAVRVSEDIAALCVSRPTNPTSNVLTESELLRLSALAAQNEIPLIIDNAYGSPFPNIIFTDGEPIWNENIILTMSLSKLGLPGVRTGIVIANEMIVRAVSSMNAIVSLAPGSFGAVLAHDVVASGDVLELSRRKIRPFYERKSQRALGWLRNAMKGLPYRVHKPEGAFFLWLWLENMPITSQVLYERLKKRGVLVVPGHYFFPGLDEPWRHKQECLRVNYSQEDDVVRKGIAILAEEIRRAFSN